VLSCDYEPPKAPGYYGNRQWLNMTKAVEKKRLKKLEMEKLRDEGKTD
jgi:hypothetical protein